MSLAKTNRVPLSDDRNTKGGTRCVRERILSWLSQYFMISLFFLLSLTLVLPGLLIAALWRVNYKKRRQFTRRVIRFWLTMGQRLRTLVIYVHQPEIFKNLRGTIVICNHPSLIDAFLLLSLLPDAACVMRGGISNDKLLGTIARLLAYVPNDRGHVMIREGAKILKEGGNLLIFPEGTRTRNQAVGSFKKGFALLAVRTGCPLQTIFIERRGKYLSKDVSLFYPAELPLYYRIHPGATVYPKHDESAKQLAARVEEDYWESLQSRGDEIFLKSNLSFFSCDAIRS